MMTYTHFVGIDIAAATATVSQRSLTSAPSPAWQIEQTPAAYAALIDRLSEQVAATTLVVMEASGSDWLALAYALDAAGFVVSVVNPSQPKHFARMRLQRTKTDAVDAQLLADYACLVQPERWTPPPAIYHPLQQRLTQRQALLDIQTQERNRLHAWRQSPQADAAVLARLEAHLAYLRQQIAELTAELEALLAGEHAWAGPARRLRTIPGMGPLSTAWVLVATQAFTRCDTPEQAAAFAGLAPHAHDSGTSVRGHRSVGHGGHKALRDCLYMAAASAARFNPLLAPLYQRLLARGKAKKLARCAVARKLLHQCWAIVVHDVDFDPHYHSKPLCS